MTETNNQLTGMYQGVELYQAEIEVLKTLEQLLNESIPYFKKKIKSITFGFLLKTSML
jgi:hypothetical protein